MRMCISKSKASGNFGISNIRYATNVRWMPLANNEKPIWHANYEDGWAKTPDPYLPFPDVTYPKNPSGPDELEKDPWLWPNVIYFQTAIRHAYKSSLVTHGSVSLSTSRDWRDAARERLEANQISTR